MTITPVPEVERRLKAEASRRGVDADRFLNQLIEAALPLAPEKRPNQSSIDLLNAWEAQTTTDDPREIALRQVEFEEFKRELNQTRLMTDGPNARVPFP